MADPTTRPAGGRRVHFETYGCTTNMGDTRTMEGLLLQAGHALVDDPEDADVVVVNTCTVVDTTDQRIGDRLRRWHADGKQVVAAGCMAAAQPDAVMGFAPASRLLAPRHLHHVVDVIEGREFVPSERPKSSLPRTLGAADAIVQLSEGCLFSCSYCLTKTARGHQSSYPMDELVADVREAVNAGAVEIKLTSQDTSGYGWDLGTELPALLERMTAIGGDFRLRVGMMHPRTAYRTLDRLLDAMDHPKVFKFLHLPIQTGSPDVLKRMQRGHPMEEFWAVVEAFRARFSDGTASTDIIVGHPGETDADHQTTMDLLRRLQAEHVNVTRFSPRPGTPSKQMRDRPSTQVAKARSTAAIKLVLSMWGETNPRHIGAVWPILVTEQGKKPDSVLGRGPGYQPVAIQRPSSEVPLGSLVDVRITEGRATYFVGEPAGPPRLLGKARRGVIGTRLPVVR